MLLSELVDLLERFAPAGAAVDLLEDVDEAVAKINAKRPLSEQVVEKLQTDILYDRVHSSAVTEGNRLSRRETIVVLTTGLVEAGVRRDELEVKNLAEAILLVEQALKDGLPLDVALLRKLHNITLRGLDANAGQFRSENVAISGAKAQPPNHFDVPDLVRGVLEKYRALTVHPLQKAAWVHWALARVHAFKDGNGRISRLVQDYALLSEHYVPSPLSSADREGQYYQALEEADTGNGIPLLELVSTNCLRMADRYTAIINEFKEKEDWLSKVTVAATEKVRQTQHRRFLSLQRASNLLKSEFYTLTGQLRDAIPGLTVAFRDYGSLEFEQFQDLEQRGHAKRTWFFGVDFRIGNSVLRYIFWYGAFHRRPEQPFASPPSKVVILVSGEEEQQYFRLLDELEDDRVSLREILPSGTSFWRRRFNPVDEKQEWDLDLEAGVIARTFFEEVLAKLGLL